MRFLSSLLGKSSSTSSKEVSKDKYMNEYIAVRSFFFKKANAIEKVFNSNDVNSAFRNEQHNITKYVQEYTVFDDKQYIPTDPKHIEKLDGSELKDITPQNVLENVVHLAELFHSCKTDVQLATANIIREQIKKTGIKNDKTNLVLNMFNEGKDFDFKGLRKFLNPTEIYVMAPQDTANSGEFAPATLTF